MTDNETRPVWLSPDGKVWSTDSTQPYRHDRIFKATATYGEGPLDAPPADAVPLVRADEAQAEVTYWRKQHEEMGDDRDRWKVKYEREKELATTFCEQNRDVLADRDRWKAECEKAQAERDELHAAYGEECAQRRRYENALDLAASKLAAAVDPDPTSASRLRLAEETLNAVADGDRHCRATRMAADLYARRRVLLEAEAVSAREQERDAEIAAVARRLHDNDDTTTGTIGWDELMEATRHRYRDKAEVAIAALDAVRNERGQK